MRILTVGNMYPPHHLGGYELVWRDAVRHLRGQGHAVRVLTSDYRNEAPGGGREDEDVHRELRWYWRDHEFPRLSAAGRLALERHNARVLARHLDAFRPELVSWWAMGGMSLSMIERVRRAGLSANAVVCDDWLVYGPRVDAWTRALGRRPRLGRLAEVLSGAPASVDLRALRPALFPSEALRRRAVEEAGIAGGEVCPQGVDMGLFRLAPPRGWSWRLLYVGRIDPRKGIDLAIRALVDLPGELTIAGGGDMAYRAELERLAAGLGLAERVRFVFRPREELPELYAGADALLFPVIWQEPWGLVPLEAMATGLPVIATGRGGSGEYLRDGENCLLFDPDDGEGALAATIERLAANEELRARLRDGGLSTARRFSAAEWNRAVERLCSLALGRDAA